MYSTTNGRVAVIEAVLILLIHCQLHLPLTKDILNCRNNNSKAPHLMYKYQTSNTTCKYVSNSQRQALVFPGVVKACVWVPVNKLEGLRRRVPERANPMHWPWTTAPGECVCVCV